MSAEALVRLLERLEDEAESYVTLEDVDRSIAVDAAALSASDVTQAIADGLLLVDDRRRLDGTAVTLCRLNRHHSLVAQLTSW
jgi:hypothetical protein